MRHPTCPYTGICLMLNSPLMRIKMMKLERPRPTAVERVLSAAPVWVQTSHAQKNAERKVAQDFVGGPKYHSLEIDNDFFLTFLQREVNSPSHCCDTDRKYFIELRRDCWFRYIYANILYRLRFGFCIIWAHTRHSLMSLLRKCPIWCNWIDTLGYLFTFLGVWVFCSGSDWDSFGLSELVLF